MAIARTGNFLFARDGRSQFAMFAYRESLGIVGEHLNADVIGARGVMFLDAAQHGLHITQAITASTSLSLPPSLMSAS